MWQQEGPPGEPQREGLGELQGINHSPQPQIGGVAGPDLGRGQAALLTGYISLYLFLVAALGIIIYIT